MPPLPNTLTTIDFDFWLDVVSFHQTRPSKANDPPVSLIFCQSICPPKLRATLLPTRSYPAPHFSNVTPNINFKSYWLIVISWPNGPLRPRPPPLFRCHFGAPNRRTQRNQHAPGRRVPAIGLQGAVALRFGSMADGSMEMEGKAAGGRVAGSSLSLCLCVLQGWRRFHAMTYFFSFYFCAVQKVEEPVPQVQRIRLQFWATCLHAYMFYVNIKWADLG